MFKLYLNFIYQPAVRPSSARCWALDFSQDSYVELNEIYENVILLKNSPLCHLAFFYPSLAFLLPFCSAKKAQSLLKNMLIKVLIKLLLTASGYCVTINLAVTCDNYTSTCQGCYQIINVLSVIIHQKILSCYIW